MYAIFTWYETTAKQDANSKLKYPTLVYIQFLKYCRINVRSLVIFYVVILSRCNYHRQHHQYIIIINVVRISCLPAEVYSTALLTRLLSIAVISTLIARGQFFLP